MNAVRKDVEALVQKELEAANKKFPLFHSAHEGYAVLLEEIDELNDARTLLKDYCVQDLWRAVKSDNTMVCDNIISYIRSHAVDAACEAIQVAAMCEKFEILLSGEADIGGKKYE